MIALPPAIGKDMETGFFPEDTQNKISLSFFGFISMVYGISSGNNKYSCRVTCFERAKKLNWSRVVRIYLYNNRIILQ